jgi:hypothetical protein
VNGDYGSTESLERLAKLRSCQIMKAAMNDAAVEALSEIVVSTWHGVTRYTSLNSGPAASSGNAAMEILVLRLPLEGIELKSDQSCEFVRSKWWIEKNLIPRLTFRSGKF